MRRRRCLSLENLEVRSLLSGLTYSLTTGQSSYQIGQPITMTFTETNTGDQPVTVEVSPTDFAAAPAGAAQGATPSWQSNPENQGATTTPETLQPGQSLSQTATWDGSLTGMVEPGESSGYAYGSFVVTNPNAPQGTTAAFQIASPFKETLTTDQSTYQLGQTIHFTFTRTNTSDEPAVFTPSTFAPFGFDVTQDGQTVQTSFPYVYDGPAIFPIVLQPGQTWSTQGTWDGLEYPTPSWSSGVSLPPYSGEGTDQTITGSFVVTYVSDPAVSASFQIQPSPLTYSLDLSQIGPVTSVANDFSYTITNTSDQPVTFNLSPADFIVTSQYGDNSPVWESDPGAASQPTTSETLQPGQSLTETASWAQMTYEGPSVLSNVTNAVTLSVSVLGAPANLTSTFDYETPLRGEVTVTGGTTDASGDVIYQPGQPFVLTATETNATNQPVTVMNDADNFDIYQWWNDTTLTIPATGTSSDGQLVTLQPGQSQTFTATWDPGANPNSPAPDGEYQVGFEDAFDNFSGPAIFVGTPSGPAIFVGTPVSPNPAPVVTLPPGSTPPVTPPSPTSSGPLAVTASASQRASQPGAPVRITLTLDNVSPKKVHLGRFKWPAEITLLRGSTVVATARKRLSMVHDATLKPGRSLHLSTGVKIKPTPASLWVLAPGTYTVEVEDGSYSATTTLDIGRS
jgi:hypothetical protein